MADLATLGAAALPEAVAAMAAAGVGWIQLRAKPRPPAPPPADRDLLALAERCAAAVAGTGARLWIDDRADLAALLALGGLPVAGLHVGQRDLPPSAARQVVGDALWIGQSTHDEAQLAAAAEDPEVDVIAVGPVFPTCGKAAPDPVVGLDLVRRARARTDKPLVAIGGIDAANLGAVLAAGADTVAVLGAACRGDVGESCRALAAAADAAGRRSRGAPAP
ncbi:MAG TPA: thiamine phosphate synthase [Thermoanaerobaculia bacterium]|nr:thiamine phosphate synthase [Thermoanaerobaculia bacterium]